ncbi:MAG: DUF423 domain-containing protein [Chakrabartia sp.]
MSRALAAAAAALAIAAGAFGAHAAHGPASEWLKTGSFYLLTHAIVVLSLEPRHKVPARLLLGGATLFALTLYGLALGAPRWLGAVTPLGGGAMILGWVWLSWRLARA